MSKSTLINHRINKPANKSGLQQSLVPGSSTGKGSSSKMGDGRGKNTVK